MEIKLPVTDYDLGRPPPQPPPGEVSGVTPQLDSIHHAFAAKAHPINNLECVNAHRQYLPRSIVIPVHECCATEMHVHVLPLLRALLLYVQFPEGETSTGASTWILHSHHTVSALVHLLLAKQRCRTRTRGTNDHFVCGDERIERIVSFSFSVTLVTLECKCWTRCSSPSSSSPRYS